MPPLLFFAYLRRLTIYVISLYLLRRLITRDALLMPRQPLLSRLFERRDTRNAPPRLRVLLPLFRQLYIRAILSRALPCALCAPLP